MRCHDFIIGRADSRNALLPASEFKSRRVQPQPERNADSERVRSPVLYLVSHQLSAAQTHTRVFNLVAKSDCNCSLVRQNGIKLRKIGARRRGGKNVRPAVVRAKSAESRRTPRGVAVPTKWTRLRNSPAWATSLFLSLSLSHVRADECRRVWEAAKVPSRLSFSLSSQCEKDETVQQLCEQHFLLSSSFPRHNYVLCKYRKKYTPPYTHTYT
jgi:hypothetical protein